MGKQILATLGCAVSVFVLMAAWLYFTGVDGWLTETLNWVFPSAVGYFFGYRHARIDQRSGKNR